MSAVGVQNVASSCNDEAEEGEDDSFFFDEAGAGLADTEEDLQGTQMDPRQVAREEIARYKDFRLTKEEAGLLKKLTMLGEEGGMLLSKWLGTTWSNKFENIAVVARQLLSFPASAGGLERDFCVAKQVLSPLRASLSPATFDEIMCLHHLSPDMFPAVVPELDDEFMEKYRSSGLRSEDVQRHLAGLEDNVSDIEEHTAVGRALKAARDDPLPPADQVASVWAPEKKLASEGDYVPM